MGDYFKSWRRKTGLIVLVMVLPFMVGWTRSLSHFDWLRLDLGERGEFCVMSQGQLLGIQCDHGANLPNVQSPLDWGSGTHSGLVKLLADDSINWSIRSQGFGCGNVPGAAGDTDYYVIPYPSIVMPITLLSAYFLLSKPHAPKSTPAQAASASSLSEA